MVDFVEKNSKSEESSLKQENLNSEKKLVLMPRIVEFLEIRSDMFETRNL